MGDALVFTGMVGMFFATFWIKDEEFGNPSTGRSSESWRSGSSSQRSTTAPKAWGAEGAAMMRHLIEDAASPRSQELGPIAVAYTSDRFRQHRLRFTTTPEPFPLACRGALLQPKDSGHESPECE